MPRPFIIFGSPQIDQTDIDAVVAVMESGWLGTGPKVAEFESDFARYKSVPVTNVAAVNSCTAALHLSILAANIGPGDEVITTPLTFCATINAIIHSGATPVLVDIDPTTMNIDVARLEEHLTKRTKAILPVHFAGYPCQMDTIVTVAKAHGLLIIEDCAHAIETLFNERQAGTIGDFGCFSFYVTKNVVTVEGGMVIARNPNHVERIKVLALHGMSKDAWHRFGDSGYKHYNVVECGYKYNMTDIQAAIGIQQLRRVEANYLRRKNVWHRYNTAFADLPIVPITSLPTNVRHAHHLYPVLVDERKLSISRDIFLQRMTDLGVGLGVHYISIPEHPYYQKKFRWHVDDYPIARDIGRQTASLPLSPKLTDDDVEYIISATRLALNA